MSLTPEERRKVKKIVRKSLLKIKKQQRAEGKAETSLTPVELEDMSIYVQRLLDPETYGDCPDFSDLPSLNPPAKSRPGK